MDFKVQRFLSKIAKRFCGKNYDVQELKAIFNKAVETIPEKQKKLKLNLEKHRETHFDFFHKCFQEHNVTATLSSSSSSTILHRTNSFIGDAFVHQSSSEVVSDLKRYFDGELNNLSVTETTRKLCQIANASDKAAIVHAVANVLYSFFSRQVDSILVESLNCCAIQEVHNSIFKAGLIIRSLFDHFSLFNKRIEEQLDTSLPKPCHLMSALFSCYIDLGLVLAKLDNTFVNKLVEVESMFFGDYHELVLDTLLQIQGFKAEGAFEFLKPLLEKVLLQQNWNQLELSPLVYLQLLLVIRLIKTWWNKPGTDYLKQYERVALLIPAPITFYKWTMSRAGGEDILDTTPITCNSTSQFITDFLIKESDIETLEDLTELCHANNAEEGVKKNFHMDHDVLPEKSTDSLFFVDTNPSKLFDEISDGNESDEKEHVQEVTSECDELINEYSDEEISNNQLTIPQSTNSRKRARFEKTNLNLCPVLDDIMDSPKGEKKKAKLNKKPHANSESSTGGHSYETRSRPNKLKLEK